MYMQYALALRQLGCDVYWLEKVRSPEGDEGRPAQIAEFLERMERFGLEGKVILYHDREKTEGGHGEREYIGMTRQEAEAVFRNADLLLNFHYAIDPSLLALFRRTALVDIDPGLLQMWISTGQLAVAPHDVYLTTGETVGTPVALFPDCGIDWRRIRPPVCLEHWPYTFNQDCQVMTTVSSWWSYEWIEDEPGHLFENSKRVSFMEFVELPRRTSQKLELALCLGSEPPDFEQRFLESHGWRVRHAFDAAGTPGMYQSYVQHSRGEFSCAKPTCMKFQNAWVSDRTLCYLASGKPVVVQHTGPSTFLPSGEGMFRFKTMEDAAAAFDAINADYVRHCRAAREIAQAHFDSRRVMERILNLSLHPSRRDADGTLLHPVEAKVAGGPETCER